MSEIRDRIEKFIGDAPDFFPVPIKDDKGAYMPLISSEKIFNNWRDDLIERLANQAKIVGCYYTDGDYIGTAPVANDPRDTHTCIAIDFQPTRKGVTKSELINHLNNTVGCAEMARRIESEGIISD
jgi:hypothetical protein